MVVVMMMMIDSAVLQSDKGRIIRVSYGTTRDRTLMV